MGRVSIGTAGWSIPGSVAASFPADGSALERYASRFPVAEINSSFHRPHRPDTWARWRDSTPDDFRFSVKLPKAITHERKLADFDEPLTQFLGQVGLLGSKLAVLLVQLPPKLAFDAGIAGPFFASLTASSIAAVACEPRHPSWFDAEAGALLEAHGVARVAADPAICDAARHPGGSARLSYWRLHGSPRMYRSSYADRVTHYAALLGAEAVGDSDVWCIFDNTASSAAAQDALALIDTLSKRAERAS